MSQITNLSFTFPEAEWEKLKRFLEEQGTVIEKTSFGFRARFEEAVVNWYSSGRLLLQGKGAGDLAEELYLRGWLKTSQEKTSRSRIGVDEAGKGDYFGPLVVAGMVLEPEQEWRLVRFGVRDSKTISETTIKKIAREIKCNFSYNLVVISPRRYNQLYQKMGNLNQILAWAHSRVIENLLEKSPVELAISDQFGKKEVLVNRLMEKGKTIKLIQSPRAEQDLAVAGASILARAEFLRQLDLLSRRFQLELPKGVSEKVLSCGKKLVERYGEKVLEEVAKLHFKTTKKILND